MVRMMCQQIPRLMSKFQDYHSLFDTKELEDIFYLNHYLKIGGTFSQCTQRQRIYSIKIEEV